MFNISVPYRYIYDMGDKDLLNTLVFLTVHAERWLRDANPKFSIPLSNRIARVAKVFDWDTDEGKILLAAREKTGKWGNLKVRDYKFVLSIYYPELIKDGRHGLIVDEMMPRMYPDTDFELFSPLPDWMLEDLRAEKVGDAFTLVPDVKGENKKGKTVDASKDVGKPGASTAKRRKVSKKTVKRKRRVS